MYLSLLSEKEKKLFLGLAYKLSSIDGEFSEEEKIMIDSYCMEMHIKHEKEIQNMSLHNIIKDLSNIKDLKIKKIIVFEAIGLAMSDRKYDEEERELILNLANNFKIEEKFIIQSEELLYKFINNQLEINALVLE